MLKKCLSVLLSLVILCSVFGILPISVSAQEADIAEGGAETMLADTGYTAHTRDEAVQWALDRSNDGVTIGSGECVAFVQAYYEYLGVSAVRGNGYDYKYNELPSGWTRIWNYDGFVPQPGDVCVWDKYAYLNTGGQTGAWGHVGVVISGNSSTFNTVEQNAGGRYPSYKSGGYARITSYATCFIRPDFKDQPSPIAFVDKGAESYYTIGEETTISVDAPDMVSAIMYIYHTPNEGSTYLYWEGEIFTNQYTTTFYKEGHYSCVFNVNFGSYQTESEWVGWNIIEKPMVNLDKGENSEYCIGEPVSFSLNSSIFDTYVLVVYRTPEGGVPYKYWEGEVFGPNYSMTFNDEGHYSCCFCLWKNGVYYESGWVGWVVYQTSNAIILGDVDSDGEVTIIDATAIQRHLASIPTASYNEKAADADGDGSVTILDATAIQRHLAQLLTNENIGKPIA